MSIVYNFYKEVDGMKVYKELLGNKYSIELKEDGKTVCVHFYFDPLGNLIIDNVYKNMRNYSTYRYIKRYAENKALIDTMMKFKTI